MSLAFGDGERRAGRSSRIGAQGDLHGVASALTETSRIGVHGRLLRESLRIARPGDP